ncbi:hypothetical protein Plo01_64740 [Planobispora longispora]|uniref:Uncharacterized protein n=1 Tax=Planobispora longispora TaxID=28887 RepID=A0A8J3W8M5_9ACTN|nr:hypothetical protein Plo01_64740 [Planobispora longispora]
MFGQGLPQRLKLPAIALLPSGSRPKHGFPTLIVNPIAVTLGPALSSNHGVAGSRRKKGRATAVRERPGNQAGFAGAADVELDGSGGVLSSDTGESRRVAAQGETMQA